jgi:hypothetical protein
VWRPLAGVEDTDSALDRCAGLQCTAFRNRRWPNLILVCANRRKPCGPVRERKGCGAGEGTAVPRQPSGRLRHCEIRGSKGREGRTPGQTWVVKGNRGYYAVFRSIVLGGHSIKNTTTGRRFLWTMKRCLRYIANSCMNWLSCAGGVFIGRNHLCGRDTGFGASGSPRSTTELFQKWWPCVVKMIRLVVPRFPVPDISNRLRGHSVLLGQLLAQSRFCGPFGFRASLENLDCLFLCK